MDGLEPGDPDRIGAYRLLGRLGEGGMGRVYLGTSPGGRKVAIKIVHPGHESDPEFRRRFAREVAAARQVGGFHAALVVDADPDGDPPWMATAYIPGPSLAEAVARRGPLPPAGVRELGAALAEGLAAIHACGIIHRDLKPGNVILADDGPRIIDFGIAKGTDASSLTGAFAIIGTLRYMSPEQVNGRALTAQSDVFALGAVLAYAATGRDAFDAPTVPAIIARICFDPPDLDPLAGDLRDVIASCLAKQPGDRPAPADLLVRLNAAEAGSVPVGGATLGRVPVGGASRDVDGGPQSGPRPVSLAATGTAWPQPTEPALAPGREPPSASTIGMPGGIGISGDARWRPGPAVPAPHQADVPGGLAPGRATSHRKIRGGDRTGPERRRVRTRVVLASTGACAIAAAIIAAVTLIGSPGPGGVNGTGQSPDNSLGSQSSPATSPTSPPPTTPSPASPSVTTPVDQVMAAYTDPGKRDSNGFGALAVAYSPDGGTLATADDNGNTYLWDTATGQPTITLADPHGGGDWSVAFSPDGKTVATGDAIATTYLWDAATGRRLAALPGPPATASQPEGFVAYQTAFSPDGKTLAVAYQDGSVYLWDIATRQRTSVFTIPDGWSGGALAFSPDGKSVAIGSSDPNSDRAYLLNPVTGDYTTLVGPGSGPNQGIRKVAFSPDGGTLAVGNSWGGTYLWDVAAGRLKATLTGPGKQPTVGGLAFSPDGSTLATADWVDNQIYLWNVSTGSRVTTLTKPDDANTNGLAYSPDGKALAVASGTGTTYLWRVG